MTKMDNATFLRHLDVIISETLGSTAMNEAWRAIMLEGDQEGTQADIAGHVLASTTLGVGNWHLESGGEIAVNTARKTVLNYCGDEGPELLVGDAAQALLAEYASAVQCEPPAIDNKTWMPAAELDPIEDEPDREDDHFTLGCPSRA